MCYTNPAQLKKDGLFSSVFLFTFWAHAMCITLTDEKEIGSQEQARKQQLYLFTRSVIQFSVRENPHQK